jgi:hypothetical protein
VALLRSRTQAPVRIIGIVMSIAVGGRVSRNTGEAMVIDSARTDGRRGPTRLDAGRNRRSIRNGTCGISDSWRQGIGQCHER